MRTHRPRASSQSGRAAIVLGSIRVVASSPSCVGSIRLRRMNSLDWWPTRSSDNSCAPLKPSSARSDQLIGAWRPPSYQNPDDLLLALIRGWLSGPDDSCTAANNASSSMAVVPTRAYQSTNHGERRHRNGRLNCKRRLAVALRYHPEPKEENRG